MRSLFQAGNHGGWFGFQQPTVSDRVIYSGVALRLIPAMVAGCAVGRRAWLILLTVLVQSGAPFGALLGCAHRGNIPPRLSVSMVDEPSPDLTPLEVVEKQLVALQRGDVAAAFAFASPDNKRITGPWQKFEMMVRQTPAYSPLVSCTSCACHRKFQTPPQRAPRWPCTRSLDCKLSTRVTPPSACS